MTRPLLVIDGDSFAHRSYHALPKTIRRRGNKAKNDQAIKELADKRMAPD
jgi:5'-3' exonuclease